jgi:hypothetical protein
MGSSDPLLARFEIWFGSLNFQATGNGYLMRITNRDELRARRQTGSAPVPVAPVAGTPTPASTNAVGPSAPRRRQCSDQHSRQAQMERQRAAVPPHMATRPPARRQPLRRGSARFQDRDSPSACAALRRRTSPPPTPTWRCAGFALAAMFQPSGTPALPPMTSRPTAPPVSCHPPLCTGTRSGTSPTCLTQ